MPKIPSYPPMTAPDGADEIPIEDISAGATKYITLTKLKEWLQALVSWVSPSNIDFSLMSSYAQTTTSQGSITGTETDLTSLSATITVPAGARVKITYALWVSTTVANDLARVFVKEGATYFGFNVQRLNAATAGFSMTGSIVIEGASAGAHTYKLSLLRQSGTGTLTSNAGTLNATNTVPFILAEIC